jgi:Uncharacterized protein conserved in bacteria (DUF2219)
MINRLFLAVVVAGLTGLVGAVLPVQAEGRSTLGFGRLFTNDLLGDGYDRWRTGSYSLSVMRGPDWTGNLPQRPFELLEYRFGTEIIAPSNLMSPSPLDRRYAGILSAGLSTHFALGGAEVSVGAGVTAVGPGTGLGSLQHSIHERFGYPDPAAALANQLGNKIIPTAEAEIGRAFRLSPDVQVRPFVELRAGDEALVRVGGDIVIGAQEPGAFQVRDDVTGYRVTAISRQPRQGLAVILGGDVARVFASEWLPDGGAASLSPTRTRLRAGLSYRTERVGVFYGLTWLGEEFEAQPHGQVLGSIRIDVAF